MGVKFRVFIFRKDFYSLFIYNFAIYFQSKINGIKSNKANLKTGNLKNSSSTMLAVKIKAKKEK